MKSVIIVSYIFPPEGSAGTFRPLRFVRHLSKMGWRTRVFSVDPYRYERYDHDLLTMVPKEAEIIRVKASDPWQALQAWREKRIEERVTHESVEVVEQIRAAHHTSLRSFARETVRKAEAWYYLPDMAMPWIRPAVEAIVHECARKPSNVIWATVGPVSSGVVAQQASERTGLPYVLDFRDPWGLNYYESEVSRPKVAARSAYRIMERILKRAQAVVFLFDTLAECYQRAYPGALDDKKIHIIPNGYDGSIEEFMVPNGDKCTILYTGTLATYRYDTLLHALKVFKKTEPMPASRLRLLFVGEGMEELAREATKLGVSDMVETRGAIPFFKITSLLREAHAYLILGRESERKGHELVAGAKLFGYFQGRRPIIGVLPKDETKKILKRVGVSTIADVDSRSEIIASLRRVFDAWMKGTLASLLPDRAACEVYSAEQQASAMVRALDALPPTEEFVAGSVEIPQSLRGEIGNGRL